MSEKARVDADEEGMNNGILPTPEGMEPDQLQPSPPIQSDINISNNTTLHMGIRSPPSRKSVIPIF